MLSLLLLLCADDVWAQVLERYDAAARDKTWSEGTDIMHLDGMYMRKFEMQFKRRVLFFHGFDNANITLLQKSFATVSKYPLGVGFGSMDCLKNKRICDKYDGWTADDARIVYYNKKNRVAEMSKEKDLRNPFEILSFIATSTGNEDLISDESKAQLETMYAEMIEGQELKKQEEKEEAEKKVQDEIAEKEAQKKKRMEVERSSMPEGAPFLLIDAFVAGEEQPAYYIWKKFRKAYPANLVLFHTEQKNVTFLKRAAGGIPLAIVNCTVEDNGKLCASQVQAEGDQSWEAVLPHLKFYANEKTKKGAKRPEFPFGESNEGFKELKEFCELQAAKQRRKKKKVGKVKLEL